MADVDTEMFSEIYESAFADAILRLEDQGWSRLGFGEDLNTEEASLDSIKNIMETTRGLASLNPLAKRGVGVRTSYIWGKGIKFKGLDDDDSLLSSPVLRKMLFGDEAHAEMEKALATDGNFAFVASGRVRKRYARGTKRPTGFRVPFTEITGIVTNPDNREEVWFYKREWTRTSIKAQEATGTAETRRIYYPTELYLDYLEATGKSRVTSISGIPVSRDETIFVHSVNKMVGWRYGLPDLTSVIFWLRGHKEFLEDQAKLVKAYSRFAFKATTVTPKGVHSAAAAVASPASRDAYGNPQDIGGTAVVSQGANIQAMGRTAGSVDFSAGIPLAGYVAAGLEIPLTDLLSDSSLSNRSSAETLSDSKLAAMRQRQNSWIDFFRSVFKFWGKDVEPYFERIEDETPVKKLQGLGLAAGLNVLYPDEVREFALEALDVRDEHGSVPTEKQLGILNLAATQSQRATNDAQRAADKQTDLSYGDNSNKADAGGAHAYDPTDSAK